MTPLSLRFQVHDHPNVRYLGSPLPVVRLVVDARMRLTDGTESETYEGAVDTGAYITVLPRYVWRTSEREILTPNILFGGVKPTKRCQVRADLARVTCVLSDREGYEAEPLTIPTYLAHTDRAPLLVGFAGLPSRYRMRIDPSTGEAWLREGTKIG
ncbi:MAG: hypothetical protein COZ06_18320 [Armatimonadetes bacterium CG_4_10_14_3_um_filter_66_18]|nr:hypothetical protein [Armatimonadota bacterium]OIP09371.1 MAG: hypothetical protein AUJ96_05270 [Armatimonadetes bacterium CG2_30_66_41]PIU92006.1 MAG: hypothetical protein COS65_20070 [Armatimonadetes bacterium CG06_land_8_20_14_3_00_66_21]PIX43372.1 MAG: hypothetical protein COZ57_19395 [Armatimonadetes bacterium CG_4_8_14_3_um_filter_66_20]PIY46688.1 MAG: hypothetical protein COZ06_18320 [Armatimonadetes bacterium CG_4_10_14_3_um_filter_66_18]PIZ32200.1 MAG: hypothetical protein COY42_31